MTWKELKERIEQAGIRDDDEVAYLDYYSYFDEIYIHRYRLEGDKYRFWVE